MMRLTQTKNPVFGFQMPQYGLLNVSPSAQARWDLKNRLLRDAEGRTLVPVSYEEAERRLKDRGTANA